MSAVNTAFRSNRIKLKSFVEFYWQDGCIFLLARPGQAITLKDPDKFIFSICSLIQNTIDLADLKIQISESHPNFVEYVTNLLEVLDKELLIECVDDAFNLEPLYVEQNSRNIEFIGSYLHSFQDKFAVQCRLADMKIAVLGTGGVGSNILLSLCGMGVSQFNIIDHDVVNLSNFNRQLIFNNDDIGKPKTSCLVNNVKKKFPAVSINDENNKIESIDDIYRTVENVDFVFACADEPRDKIINWVNKACVEKNLPFMCGGVDSRWATLFTIWPGKTGCVECWKSNAQQSTALYQDIASNIHYTPAAQPNVASIPMINTLIGLMTSDFLKVQTDIFTAQSLGNLVAYDFSSMNIEIKESWDKSKDCPVCSG